MTTFFGNPLMLDYLLNKARLSWTRNELLQNVDHVIKSDDVDARKVFHDYCQQNDIQISLNQMGKENVECMTRGKTAILDIFNVQYCHDQVVKKILSDIPKSEEFPYCEVMDKIVALVQEAEENASVTRREISFGTLLTKLHVPAVH